MHADLDPSLADARAANPLLAEWTGPYGGVLAFDRMDLAHLGDAIEAGMAEHLAEVDAIARDPAPPTFENTVVALERAGRTLDRVLATYGVWSANLSSPEFRDVQARVEPRLAAHTSQVVQNADLYARVAAVHQARQSLDLTPEQVRLVELVSDGFTRNGATLTGTAKARYAAIEQRLAELYTAFSDRVLADEEGTVTYLRADQLGGLPDGFVAAAAVAAQERGRAGAYAVLNTRSSVDPFLTFSDHRALRETVWQAFTRRGDNGDENDTNAIIAEILALRHERVGLLGYDTYADWRLEDRMAKTPARARDLMLAIWPAAVARVEQEVADMQEIADQAGDTITIEPWDYLYYAEIVRQQRYALDAGEVEPYLQLDKLNQAMHWVAGELFGLEFAAVTDGSVPVFHPDVTVFEVTDRGTGAHVGLWYLDPFARAGKRSGAWATTYRSHSTVAGPETVLSSNNSNFVPGPAGEPVLVSWDNAETLFHEFGHALHSLTSRADYPTLDTVVRDFVEFQSQLLERWLLTDPVVERFLVHVETGESMPAALVEKVRRAATFNQGHATVEYLASALVDLDLHTLHDYTDLDPAAFERAALARLGMPAEVGMRHRTPHFAHVFSGEGYAAGYYSYLWADVLTADAVEAFAQAPGGHYDAALAARMVALLFAPRNAVDPGEAYREFRGRAAGIEPLMRDRGFPVPA